MNRAANWAVLTLNLTLVFLAFWITIGLSAASPLPRLSWVPWVAGIFAVLEGLRRLIGRTAGRWLLELFPSVARVPVLGAALILCFVVVTLVFDRHPLLRRAWLQEPEASLPSSAEVLPFYYALGAWPREFRGRPVFHALPYEKSVPDRFVPRAIARWHMPDTRVIFEGPQTPQFEGGRVPPADRGRIRACMLGESKAESWLSCARLREAVLERHLDEMNSAVSPRFWDLSWLQVQSPSLPSSEQVQGFYVSATGSKRAQDRFVLITEKGMHQAFILDYPATPEGQEARRVFQASLKSLRASDSLTPGRAWVDQQLQASRLDSLRDAQSAGDRASFLGRISAIQALLVAKATVDPKSFDTFFHLGGTALLLSRFGRETANTPAHDDFDDWKALPKQLADSAFRYAKDISPEDPRTKQMEMLALEAK